MSVADQLKALREKKAMENLKAGKAFLEASLQQPGTVALPSGLLYCIIRDGAGDTPTVDHTVTCHYTGTTIQGEVFDSSVQRGRPASFPLKSVIKGWQEGIPLMMAGSIWKFFIPPHLAYGDRQVNHLIPAHSTLVFEVELISFQ